MVQFAKQGTIVCDQNSEGDPLLTVLAKAVSSSSEEESEESSSSTSEPKSSSSKNNDPDPCPDGNCEVIDL
jgi:hypothetical protein